MDKNAKKEKPVRKFKICMMGPSYVGKTQIVNRIINNSFTGFYEPTIMPDLYRFAYNLNEEDPDLDPIFFDIEIVDLFPHDHPYIEVEAELADEVQAEMQKQLDYYITNPYDEKLELMEKIHAFLFIYDSSNKRTFITMSKMFETIKALEKSKKKGGASKVGKKDKDGKTIMPPFFPKMMVLGNKKDLRKNKDAGIKKEDLEFLEGIKIKEVSALTNQGIAESFKTIINELNNDQTLKQESETHYYKVKNYIQQLKDKSKKKDEDGGQGEEDKNPKGIKDDKVAQKEGGGLFMCCGPRNEVGSDESDDVNKSVSDEEDEEELKTDDTKEKEIEKGTFLKEVDSDEAIKKFEEFKKNQIDSGAVGEKESGCQIY